MGCVYSRSPCGTQTTFRGPFSGSPHVREKHRHIRYIVESTIGGTTPLGAVPLHRATASLFAKHRQITQGFLALATGARFSTFPSAHRAFVDSERLGQLRLARFRRFALFSDDPTVRRVGMNRLLEIDQYGAGGKGSRAPCRGSDMPAYYKVPPHARG